MMQHMNKRKREDVACPAPEDASEFYKRLGLDILATSYTSGQSEESEQPRKRAVPNCRPTHGQDRVVSKWSQPQQTVRQFRNTGISESVATAAVYEKQYNRPHDHRQHCRDQKKEVVNGGPKYQPQHYPHGYMHHTYGRSEVNSGPLYNHQAVHHTHPHPRTGSERVDTRQRARPAPPQQGVVKKEPQVKPINRYAPTEYITLQYHPTPTLEDLGLTSYLDSPPSSPRATSSDQDLGHVSTSTSMITRMAEKPQAISASETVYIPRTAPKGWAPLIEVDIPSHGETPPVASMGGGNPTCTSALTSRPLQTSLAKRPRKGACDSVSHKDDLFGGVSPYSCWSQSVTEDQRPS